MFVGNDVQWGKREEKDSDEDAQHHLDVYELETEQADAGAVSAADGLLRFGEKVLVCSKEPSKRKSADFRKLRTMQVVDSSLLGRTLVQRLQPLQLIGRRIRPGNLVHVEVPLLSHIPRQRVIPCDVKTHGK